VITVVLAFGRPIQVGWHDSAASRREFWSIASGLSVRAADIVHGGEECGIQLGLTAAGARALLGQPMAALACDMAALDDVLSTRMPALYDRVAAEPSWEGKFEVLDEVLVRLLATRGEGEILQPRREVAWAWGELGRGRRVDDVAADIGWSRRHLGAQFSAEIGLAPKQFARLRRFERSRSSIAARRPLGAVAADCGYADQAHLTREWKAMAGYTPIEWLSAEFPFLQDLTAHDREPLAS
jgi:AraC-like DNA-binding protein